VRVDAPFTGPLNLFAEAAGVLTIDAGAIDALNMPSTRRSPWRRCRISAPSRPGEMIGDGQDHPVLRAGNAAGGAVMAAGRGAIRWRPTGRGGLR
jgi:hypothetical protein